MGLLTGTSKYLTVYVTSVFKKDIQDTLLEIL